MRVGRPAVVLQVLLYIRDLLRLAAAAIQYPHLVALGFTRS